MKKMPEFTTLAAALALSGLAGCASLPGRVSQKQEMVKGKETMKKQKMLRDQEKMKNDAIRN